jgi:hypothetical protein
LFRSDLVDLDDFAVTARAIDPAEFQRMSSRGKNA